MSVFDLLFLLAVLASAITLIALLVALVRGQPARALRILTVYVICAAGYLATGLAASFLKSQRVIRVGNPWCFDDWCITVQEVEGTPTPSGASYLVKLRIFSQARRVSQRAKGAWIYLLDDRGRRYAPDADPSAVPLEVLLEPQQSVTTSRIFHLPAGARPVGLVTGHGGPYCGAMSFLVIGEAGCLFGKPTMVGLGNAGREPAP